MRIFNNLRQLSLRHWHALVSAFIVGAIVLAPIFAFQWSLGDAYKGIYMYATPNENAYVSIIHEIIDGYPLVASMPFYEYKDAVPLLPATIAWIYALPTVLFGISLVTSVILFKFIFASALFLAVYAFAYLLFRDGSMDEKWTKWSAIAAGSLVVFGFDLVDYNSLLQFIRGVRVPQGFIVWARPLNPVSGGVLLFIFLSCIWKLWDERKKKYILIAGVALALMMASYVFSWTIAAAVAGLVALFHFYKKNFRGVKDIVWIFVTGLLASSPYWINMARASKSPWYEAASKRIGLLLTHEPHFNKLLGAALIVFILGSLYSHFVKQKEIGKKWWWMSLFLILSGFVAYNQQVITGHEIWYPHYVFYTIPFVYIATLALFSHVIRPRVPRIWKACIVGILVVSSGFGIWVQYNAYHARYAEFAARQSYREIFDFLNQAPKDCVVLIKEKNILELSNLVPMFTHCNTYFSREVESVLMPPARILHNYLTILRLRGVTPDDVEEYVKQNKEEVSLTLQFQLQRTLGYKDTQLEELLKNFKTIYTAFYTEPFIKKIREYKADYILAEGDLLPEIKKELPLEGERVLSGQYHLYMLK